MQTFPPLPLCSAKCIRKHTAERLSCVFCPMLMPLHIVCTNKTLLPRPPAPSVDVKMQTLLIAHFTARDFSLTGKTGTLSRAPVLFGLHVHRTVLLPLQRSQRTSENIGPSFSRTLHAYVRHGWHFVETETSSKSITSESHGIEIEREISDRLPQPSPSIQAVERYAPLVQPPTQSPPRSTWIDLAWTPPNST